MVYYIYILRSLKDNYYYTGYTNNLESRINEHQKGRVQSTKHRIPFELVYFEGCLNQQDAIRREKYLKTTYGKMFLGNRLKSYLSSESNLFHEDFTGQVKSSTKDELENE